MVIVFMGMRQLGALVKARREESGLTQEQLAEQVGCGHSYISKIELGRQKGLGHEMLRNLASVLGESQEHLEAVLYDEPPPRPAVVDPEIAREVPIVAIGGAASHGRVPVTEGYIYFGRSEVIGKMLRGVRVKGTCMEPLLTTGDTVVIDQTQEPRDGQVVVAVLLDTDEVVVKRFYRLNGKVKLEPNVGNPIIAPADRVKVEGVVVEMRRKIA